jgi:hypothetical protein
VSIKKIFILKYTWKTKFWRKHIGDNWVENEAHFIKGKASKVVKTL